MNVQAKRQATHVSAVSTVAQLKDIDEIFDAATDAVIWHRRVPTSVLSSFEAVPVERMSDGRFNISVSEIRAHVSALLEEWGIRDKAAQDWFARDVTQLAHHFARVLSAPRILLRVEWVQDDACRKYHRDMVKARLICTYLGPGTEYCMASERDGHHAAASVPTGDAILLKGQLWPGPHHAPIFHRSPPIEGLGVSRLVVVINEAPSDAL